MRQAEPAPDQATAGKYVLDFLWRGAGGYVKVLGCFAKNQVANATADDESLVTGVLQFFDDPGGVRTKLLEPDSMFGPGNGDKIFNVVLRFL